MKTTNLKQSFVFGLLFPLLCLDFAFAQSIPKPLKPILSGKSTSASTRLLTIYKDGIESAVEKNTSAYQYQTQFATGQLGVRRKYIQYRTQSTIRRITSTSPAELSAMMSFDGESPIRQYLVADSAPSSRVFKELDKKGLLNPQPFLSELKQQVAVTVISTEWLPLVEKLRKSAPVHSTAWIDSTIILSAATRKPEYSKSLYEVAVNKNNLGVAEFLLLGSRNVSPLGVPQGTTKPNSSYSNKANQPLKNLSRVGNTFGETVSTERLAQKGLVSALSQKTATPEQRILSALYLARSGEQRLAERICREVIALDYEGSDQKAQDVPQGDLALSRAKDAAMMLLFYEIRTDSAFRTVYDVSRDRDMNVRLRNGIDENSPQSPDTYIVKRMEMQFAKSLISTVAVDMAKSVTSNRSKQQSERLPR